MAWDDEMPIVLRDVIQDYATPPLYTDDRLNVAILVNSMILQREVSFQSAYRADVVNVSLTPDPTSTAAPGRDEAFISLVCLRAAVGLVTAEVKDMTRQGIEIQDGDSRIKLGRDPNSLKLMVQNFQKLYEDALYAYKTGGNDGLGEVITTPYKYWGDCQGGAGGTFGGYAGGRNAGCGGGGWGLY